MIYQLFKRFKRLLVVLFVSIVAYVAFSHAINRSVFSTLYNVSVILFSVGMGLIFGFNLDGIKNGDYVKSIRFQLKKIRNNFILLIMILTVLKDITQLTEFVFLQYFTITYLIYSFVYFILTFIELQKLKEQISDAINL